MVKIFYSLVLTLIILILPSKVLASTLTLSPGNTGLGVGSSKSFRVILNTEGESVNAVSSIILYPADLIEVVSISPTSTFGIQAEQTFGGGTIKISRGTINPVSGVVTVANINLKGKGVGKATVYFVGGSAVPRASDSSDSLNLSKSIGSVIDVGTTTIAQGAPVQTKASLPQAGDFETTLMILVSGTLLSVLGIIGLAFLKVV